MIGQDQYNTWKANFGMSLPGSGSLADATVLEPASVLLVIMTSIIVWGRHRSH